MRVSVEMAVEKSNNYKKCYFKWKKRCFEKIWEHCCHWEKMEIHFKTDYFSNLMHLKLRFYRKFPSLLFKV